MNKLKSKLESLLFVASKPLSVKRLSELSAAPAKEVETVLETLRKELQAEERGMQIIKSGSTYQMMTSPDNTELVQSFLKDDMTGELTKPSLETLTIIAYQGSITKAELEQIRGVNCSLIIRNLMMRGLVEVKEDKQKKQNMYSVTIDFLRFLGVSDVTELPDYDKLHSDEHIERLLTSE